MHGTSCIFANGLTKGDWGESFLFALSVAVGLTPEMLPMIVTTNLAKGAVKMAKKNCCKEFKFNAKFWSYGCALY